MKKLSREKLSRFPEFDNHHSVFEFTSLGLGFKSFVAIHRINKEMPSFGATRLLKYESERAALADVLRLSKVMTYKSALAGLPYGGAKAVIMMPPHFNTKRKAFLRSYARQINWLDGRFITGTDVGLTTADVAKMKAHSRFFVGLQGDPSTYTAYGILAAFEECLRFVYGTEDFSGRSVAIQGLGKVGSALVALLVSRGARVVAADVDAEKVRAIQSRFPGVKIVKPEVIHQEAVDIFAPCALSGVITTRNIPELRCKIIAGGANNQLEDANCAEALYQRGIVYAPDYVVNAGGLISVASEYARPSFDDAFVMGQVKAISNTIKNIFNLSREKNKNPDVLANELAEQIIHRYV